MYEKLWLAGLGAYGRYEKLGQEGKKLFEDLVEEGDEMRDELSDRLGDVKEKALGKISDTLNKVRCAVTPETEKDVEKLAPQLEELTEAIKMLTEIQSSGATKKIQIETEVKEDVKADASESKVAASKPAVRKPRASKTTV
ncbi:hypothetical protein CI610_00133 [invertebrate metagenome]|uniref:Poly(Hydroxyalcanoate) granule associated protein (Phasin) n=1 Tax=invertebrate metagenome TaxID=1711999 RepID=A0A2H9TCB0_9ZZZZ